MFILLFTRDGQTCRHPLTPGDTVVGRATICDLAIDDPSISRRHVRFRVHGDHCILSDLGGRNGTFLNGEQVLEAEIHPGDTVVLGRFPIRVDHGDPDPVVLSDEHSLLDVGETLFRRVDEETQTRAESAPAAESRRLLLLLSEISRQLVRWRPLPDILERIVAVVFETIAVERAFLLLIDERTKALVPAVSRSRDGTTLQNVTLSRTIVRRTIEERVAILAADARIDSRLAGVRSVHDANIRSFMSTPLWNQKDVIGLLYVDNPHSAQLTAADLDVLQALSSYAAVAIEQARLTATVLEETRRREALQRYHSAAVVDRILAAGRATDALMAEEREVSVMIADIVGFTTRAERMPPSAVAQLLNQCFEVMCEAVFAEDGTLDKFMGDAVLTVFGAPLPQADHAARAWRAARMLRDRVARLAVDPPIQLRVAITSGIATVGDIGSPRRREYTVLGDVVNTCARLVGYACEPGQIVMTEATRERLDPSLPLRRVGPVSLRGRHVPVVVFTDDGATSPQNE